jgi:hypothetical protein
MPRVVQTDGVARRRSTSAYVRRALVLAIAQVAFGGSNAHADDAALRSEIQELRAQLAELKAQVGQLAGQRAPAPERVSEQQVQRETAARVEKLERDVKEQMEQKSSLAASNDTTIGGYGELNYNHPVHDSSASQADVRRAVITFGHRFDDQTRMYGEFEFEHAVVSADDAGEAEVEQLYVEHQLDNHYGFRGGLMLMPFGLINEHHEPTAYYGVERNVVETAIIPSTWREGGIAFYGNTEGGFDWNVGATTGFNLSKWDSTSDEGRESPLASIHQELQLARARDIAFYASGNYRGVPGLLVGAAAFTGKAGQGAADFAAGAARVTLWDVHARWQPGPFDLSAVYAHGTISDTEDLNLTFIGNPTPVPKSFYGGYLQGAWHAWSGGEKSLTPFLRYERVNTAASFEPVPLGLGVPTGPTETIWTAGANFNLGSSVVFKIDYQKFDKNRDSDRFDLGLGYQF